jgi:hypothetical protein
MPGYLLHEGATELCAHTGQAKPTSPVSRVKVDGQAVVAQAAPYTVSGCTMPPPPSGNGPCVTAQWSTAATRVKASGQPLLLKDSQASCVPTGTPLSVSVTQMRVKGK